MAGFSDFFLGKPEQTQQFSSLNGGQNDLLQKLLSMLGGGPLQNAIQSQNSLLSNDPEAFKAFERPAMRQFNEEILPSLAEGFGGLGATSSSGAQQTFARAGEKPSGAKIGTSAKCRSKPHGLFGTRAFPHTKYSD